MKVSRLFLLFVVVFALCLVPARAEKRPNIVWIVGEDMGPELGCYGDGQAITPNMDRLAGEGARYTACFTHAPVCAPSRHGLITGQYPIKTGAHHMRSTLVEPPVTFTRLLQDAGYHVSWPGKTDFNFKQPGDFASSTKVWHKGDVPLPEPFFAYVNFGQSHESQVRNDGGKYGVHTRRLSAGQRHDPAKVVLPPFYPDTPGVREELARYYDLVTSVDYDVGDVLGWLDRHGLRENTVVFLFGDHGRGLPRYKRWVHDTGTRTPLVVRWPGKVEPGSVESRLVEFLDVTATTVSLAGLEVPGSFDGQPFLGPKAVPRRYVHAARDYMDETFDRIRSVRDGRFRYIRNFAPELPKSQVVAYMEVSKTMQAWRAGHAAGTLTGVQGDFFASSKAEEELYDCEADPFETRNLARESAHAGKLAELRAVCDGWLERTGDKGAVRVEDLIAQKVITPRSEKYIERTQKGAGAILNEVKKQGEN